MKKLFCAVLSVFILAFMLATAVNAADRGKVLIVHGTAEGVLAGDKAIGERFKSLGFGTVDYVLAKDTTETSYKGYTVVFIGESVTSADVGTKFTQADCLVICGEPGLFDELLIGNYDSTYDSNAYKGKYIIKNDIAKTGLTTFDGFKADATPGFLKEWGKGVTVVAENDKGAPAVTYTAIGAEMFDGSKAAGARITIFCRGQSAADFTDSTWKLFDALINYALPVPVAATPSSSAKTADTSGILIVSLAAAAIAGFCFCKKRS